MLSAPDDPCPTPSNPPEPSKNPGNAPAMLSSVTLPAGLLFQRELTPSVVFTYAQLLALALDISSSGEWCTACLSLEQLCTFTGKRPAALYNHLRLLKVAQLLDWQAIPGQGLVIRIPKEMVNPTADQEVDSQADHQLDHPEPAPVQPVAQLKKDRSPNLEPIPAFYQNRNGSPPSLKTCSKKEGFVQEEPESRARQARSIGIQAWTGDVKPGANQEDAPGIIPETDRQTSPDGGAEVAPQRTSSDPVQTYRELAHLTPNAQQRTLLHSQVHDLLCWQGTLEHWLAHGWNPRNLPGMLELYHRGGAQGCRYCHPTAPSAQPTAAAEAVALIPPRRQPQFKTKRQRSLTAIQQVRRALQNLSEPSRAQDDCPVPKGKPVKKPKRGGG